MDISAAVLRTPGGPLTVESAFLGDPRPSEVIVELAGTGVCHTDLSFRDGTWPFPLPAVLGHEGAGVVVATGEAVTDLAIGDHVVMSSASCGQCRACLSALPAQCVLAPVLNMSGSRPDGTNALHSSSGALHGHFVGQSSFASHALAESRFVVKVPGDLPLYLLGPLGCGVQTGAGAVLNVLQPRPGSTVAVFGLGAVGLATLAAARVSGCKRVIGVDVDPQRFALAGEFGATDVVDGSAGGAPELIRELVQGGVDAAVEASGAPPALRSAFESTHASGTTVLVGAAAPGTEYALESTSILSGRRLIGCTMGQSNPRVFIPELVALYQRGLLPLERMVCTYPLREIERAMADARSGVVVKPVVVMS